MQTEHTAQIQKVGREYETYIQRLHDDHGKQVEQLRRDYETMMQEEMHSYQDTILGLRTQLEAATAQGNAPGQSQLADYLQKKLEDARREHDEQVTAITRKHREEMDKAEISLGEMSTRLERRESELIDEIERRSARIEEMEQYIQTLRDTQGCDDAELHAKLAAAMEEIQYLKDCVVARDEQIEKRYAEIHKLERKIGDLEEMINGQNGMIQSLEAMHEQQQVQPNSGCSVAAGAPPVCNQAPGVPVSELLHSFGGVDEVDPAEMQAQSSVGNTPTPLPAPLHDHEDSGITMPGSQQTGSQNLSWRVGSGLVSLVSGGTGSSGSTVQTTPVATVQATPVAIAQAAPVAVAQAAPPSVPSEVSYDPSREPSAGSSETGDPDDFLSVAMEQLNEQMAQANNISMRGLKNPYVAAKEQLITAAPIRQGQEKLLNMVLKYQKKMPTGTRKNKEAHNVLVEADPTVLDAHIGQFAKDIGVKNQEDFNAKFLWALIFGFYDQNKQQCNIIAKCDCDDDGVPKALGWSWDKIQEVMGSAQAGSAPPPAAAASAVGGGNHAMELRNRN